MPRRYDTSGVTYSVDYAPSFGDILTDLCRVMDAVFEKAQRYPAIANQRNSLLQVLVSASSARDGVYYRLDKVEKALNTLLLHLSEIYTDLAALPQGKIRTARAMRSHAMELENLIQSAHKLVSKPYGLDDYPSLNRGVRYLTLRYSVIHPDLQSVLVEWQSELQQIAKQTAAIELADARKEITTRLRAASPDLAAAWQSTADLMNEVKGLGSLNAEDEYFIEQVEAEYIPRILRNVESAQSRTGSFDAAAAIMQEALNQFRVIEAGIQRTIQTGLYRQISEMQAQTNFLAQKVLDDKALTLTPTEAYAQIEATTAEAARIRDLLSQKMLPPAPKPRARLIRSKN